MLLSLLFQASNRRLDVEEKLVLDTSVYHVCYVVSNKAQKRDRKSFSIYESKASTEVDRFQSPAKVRPPQLQTGCVDVLRPRPTCDKPPPTPDTRLL